MIVYYDGVCGLCNRFVRWALRHDTKRRLQFAMLQGRHGVELRSAFPHTNGIDSIVVRDGDRVLVRFDAVLAIARELGGAWHLASLARVMPRGVRDRVYDAIAWRRYKWFGRLDSCPLPPSDELDRFLDVLTLRPDSPKPLNQSSE